MIAYERQSTTETPAPLRFYDLLFFRGPEIFECARLNQDLRFQLHQEVAFRTFKNFAHENDTRVFLFLASDDLLHRFRTTFYYEPCLKVQVKALSKKQIITLLKSTGCQRGIIECNEFTQLAPTIELLTISSADDILQYQPRFKNGRILLYDTEKNKELVQERYAALSERQVYSASTYTHKQESPDQTSVQIFNASKQADNRERSLDEKEAEEFTEFIKKILNSPPSSDPESRMEEKTEGRSFIITRKEEKNPTANDDSGKVKPDFSKKAKPLRKPRAKEPVDQPNADLPIQSSGSPSDQQRETLTRKQTEVPRAASMAAEAVAIAEHQGYVKLFERLFRSFRQQIFDCYGDRSEAVIAEAERKVRFLTPEFDLRSLSNDTAIVTLDLVETITNDAPFFKKSKLREAALTLVADLYNKQYELLERHRAIEKVEQFYYRLKR